MCDKHKHNGGVNEFWVTDENSKFLSSKCVVLHDGEKMPMHTTGPGKEEVIVCCAGSIKVKTKQGKTTNTRCLYTGEACFIPANTQHSVHFNKAGADHAIYVYVVNKAAPYQEVNWVERVRRVVEGPYRKKHKRPLTWEQGWGWEALLFLENCNITPKKNRGAK